MEYAACNINSCYEKQRVHSAHNAHASFEISVAQPQRTAADYVL